MQIAASGVNVGGRPQFSDYNQTSGTSLSGGAGDTEGAWDLERCKRAYSDYLGNKNQEIEEQKDARRYRHGSQLTAEQLKKLRKRKQPEIVINEVSRKIHGIVGTLSRLKQDPKAFARTPKHEEGAEIATYSLNYVLQEQFFDEKDPLVTEMAAIDGLGGLELGLVTGDAGDHDISLDPVFTDSFFYDPTSYRPDFSDAGFLGVAKWYRLEKAQEDFPKFADDLAAMGETGSDLTTNPDREQRWFYSDKEQKRVRIVQIWYEIKGKWKWTMFTGSFVMDSGDSPFYDEKGKSIHKYIMWSAYVDQDGDRYGLVRDLKPLQNEVNMRHSKGLHNLNSRRLIAPKGAFDDIEKARAEMVKPDGVVEYNPMPNYPEPKFDDAAKQADIQANLEFLKYAHERIDNYGPNIAVVGQGLDNSSGRAINLLQQAGLADLGPFIQSYRGWKIRLYRAVWNAIQRYWTGERWVRVTDSEGLSQYIQINGVGIDPKTGLPSIINSVGSLDVDIILDEGPDEVNAMGDAYDTLQTLVKSGGQVPPVALIKLAPIASSLKKEILADLQPPPDPEMQKRAAIETEHGVAKVEQTKADALYKRAQAAKALADAQSQASGANQQAASLEAQQEMQIQAAKHAQEMQHKADAHRLDMAMKAQDHQLKMAEIEAKNKPANTVNMVNETHAKALSSLADGMQSIHQGQKGMADTLNKVAEHLTRPKKVVRGGDGRVMGIE